MAKWYVEQRRLDPETNIWTNQGQGKWTVNAASAEEALRSVFVNQLGMADQADELVARATKELYGVFLNLEDKSWSVMPAGAGVPA